MVGAHGERCAVLCCAVLCVEDIGLNSPSHTPSLLLPYVTAVEDAGVLITNIGYIYPSSFFRQWTTPVWKTTQ